MVPAAATLILRLLHLDSPVLLVVVAGALRLTAVRDAAATSPLPGNLRTHSPPLGSVLRLPLAPGGAPLQDGLAVSALSRIVIVLL